MTCEHVLDQLSAYLDGVLTTEEVKLVEQHLADCSSCFHEWQMLKTTVDAFTSLEELDPPADFWNQLSQKLALETTLTPSLTSTNRLPDMAEQAVPSKQPANHWMRWFGSKPYWWAGAAAVILIAMLTPRVLLSLEQQSALVKTELLVGAATPKTYPANSDLSTASSNNHSTPNNSQPNNLQKNSSPTNSSINNFKDGSSTANSYLIEADLKLAKESSSSPALSEQQSTKLIATDPNTKERNAKSAESLSNEPSLAAKEEVSSGAQNGDSFKALIRPQDSVPSGASGQILEPQQKMAITSNELTIAGSPTLETSQSGTVWVQNIEQVLKALGGSGLLISNDSSLNQTNKDVFYARVSQLQTPKLVASLETMGKTEYKRLSDQDIAQLAVNVRHKIDSIKEQEEKLGSQQRESINRFLAEQKELLVLLQQRSKETDILSIMYRGK